MVFVSHETYTPARGGSAAAEVNALRRVFGAAADSIVIANTKGFTGHAMGAGVEDVVAVKALETGCVPPVANFKEVDPELGALNLSKGGIYPVDYALRLGAGFGSQISMTLLRWVRTKDGTRPSPNALGYVNRIVDRNAWNDWLRRMAGGPVGDLEVVHRTLRVPDQRPLARAAEANHENHTAVVPITEHQAPPKSISRTEVVPPAQIGGGNTPKVEVEVQGAVPAPLLPPRPATQSRDAGPVGLTPVLPSPTPEADPVRAKILALVSEKTGYPPDMLDLDLDLEADLGVDTVKQAEVFASVREAYGIARDDQLRLHDFPTLAHVIRFVYERRPDLAGPTGTRQAETPESKVSASSAIPLVLESNSALPERQITATTDEQGGDAVKERILELVVEKTGYPREMLDLDLDLEADLGVDTVKQAEMFAAIRAAYDIPREENLKLRDFPTLARVIQFVYDRRPDLAAPSGDRPSGGPAGAVRQPPQQLQPQTAAKSDAAGPDSVQPAGPPVTPTNGSDDSVRERILAIAAEKTGYPQEMLDLDLDLEADLGVDTVKQAEMFASVRAAFNIPRDENLKLRDFPTLAHVIGFARDRQPKLAGAPAPAGEHKPSAPEAPRSKESQGIPRPVLAGLDAANSIPRRVPIPNLRPPLAMCKPTGVTLGPGRRVIIKSDKIGVGEALAQRLQMMGVEVLRLGDEPDANVLTDRLKTWLSAGPAHGVYWLPALDNEGSLSDMDLGTWRAAVGLRVKSLYATMRLLYDQIVAPDTFLVSATRLGGQHGYDQAGATAPLGGAVVGFTKTYKRERMDALVKAVDFEPSRTASELAEILIEETLRDPGAVEIGHERGQRWTVGLQEQPAVDGQPGMVLDKDTVFLVTGAAGSIVSAITADLAAASGGTFYLLDLVPEPDPNNSDLKRFVSEREGLKRDLFARIQGRGERATPALVEKQLAAIERAVAARSAIDAVTAAGGTAHYFSVNIMDAASVAKVIDQVRERSGHIDVLLHAAGIERSHMLPDKDATEFDLVFDVKSDGWFNLLDAIGEMPLGATVAFSSIAGRFGNRGQADYSAANDLLCKIASSFRTTRPATRAIVIDWTAWGGIGMATRGSIPKMMEQAGIDMLPPEAGIPLIRRELTAGGTRGEIVIAQRLGILMNEWDSTGGLAISPADATAGPEPAPLHRERPRGAHAKDTQGPMIGKIVSMNLHKGLTIETTLDPKIQPFLRDHQIEGKPVLPGVMGIEAFAEAAQWMLPGWHVEAVEEVNFLAPFKFYRNEPRVLTIQAAFYPQGECLLADCQLTGSRPLPNQPEPQIITHFTGRVRLTKDPRSLGMGVPPPEAPARSLMEAADIYRVYFHGPAYQVLERAWRDGDRIIGQMARSLPDHHEPHERSTLVAPRLIELCFQTAGLWEMSEQGRMGLPQRVHQVCFRPELEPADGGFYAVVTPDPDHESFDAEVVDTNGNRYISLTGYQTVGFSNSVDAEPLKALQTVG
jgi:NAD(P)-dependent dehydrogenase (short-subunit alcohol dehydrogenase family)/acyl carrier protein